MGLRATAGGQPDDRKSYSSAERLVLETKKWVRMERKLCRDFSPSAGTIGGAVGSSAGREGFSPRPSFFSQKLLDKIEVRRWI
ncbi:MAG: hypothetical protein LBT74_01020 [Acidobacteriota bacterium]|jgi:hypothetical protein|nr:hypothetical protein [Acidobacteriota bacterium]